MFTPDSTVGDLLARQDFLNREARRRGTREHEPYELRIAYRKEVAEASGELETLWKWWRKKGDRHAIEVAKLTEELADALHFSLIEVLDRIKFKKRVSGLDARLGSVRVMRGANPCELLDELQSIPYVADVPTLIGYALGILEPFGVDLQGLLDAYAAKTEVNLRRWAEEPQPHAPSVD